MDLVSHTSIIHTKSEQQNTPKDTFVLWKQFHLLCTRLLQMITSSTSGENGAQQILRYTGVRGQVLRLGAKELAYTKVSTQETGPKLKQILKQLVSLLQMTNCCSE